MSTGSLPFPRGAPPSREAAAPRDDPPAISSSSDAGPTPAATICWYRVQVPARSVDESAPAGRTGSAGLAGGEADGGGFGGAAGALPSCRGARRLVTRSRRGENLSRLAE